MNHEALTMFQNPTKLVGETTKMTQVNSIFHNFSEILLDEQENIKPKDIEPTKCPEIEILIEKQIMSHALLDSGSEICAIAEEQWLQIKKQINIPELPIAGITVTGATGHKSQRITKQVFLKFPIGNANFKMPFIVIKNLVRPIIIGADFMFMYKITLDLENSLISWKNSEGTIVKNSIYTKRLESVRINVLYKQIQADIEKCEINEIGYTNKIEGTVENEIEKVVNNSTKLGKYERGILKKTLYTYKTTFSDSPGKVNNYEHEIKMFDKKPLNQKAYPVPYKLKEKVDSKISKMIEWGIIERGQSAYINPIVVVKKKDGSVRLCLDARGLNSKMIPDKERPINPEDVFNKYGKTKYFSTIDLTAGFWQIPLEKNSRQFTAFLYDGKVYQFCVLPFGLSTSVGSFSRMLRQTLGNDISSFADHYVDDIIIGSQTFEEHIKHIEIVLRELQKANLRVKLSKCKFCRDEVSFLGHILTTNGIKTDPEKLRAINEFPRPTNIKQLQSFLGLCNYYRKFIPVYANKTAILFRLLKKGIPWKWDENCQSAFWELKNKFQKTVTLNQPQIDEPYYVQTDSSDIGVGAELYQIDKMKKDKKIIAFASRVLIACEQRYTTTEREALAIVFAFQKFRMYLLGAKIIIRTDHQALTFLKSCRLLSGRLSRWILYLQEFHYEIEHCKGTENVGADTLR